MSVQLRQNIRNFLLPMTLAEMSAELEISQQNKDFLRANYIAEYMCEVIEEQRHNEGTHNHRQGRG
jgi:hypothetical protein